MVPKFSSFVLNSRWRPQHGGRAGAVPCGRLLRPASFGQGEGALGLEHGGIQIEQVGELETKDATRWRIKWYAGMSVMSMLGVARVKGFWRKSSLIQGFNQ
jgi:hypothetical protein